MIWESNNKGDIVYSNISWNNYTNNSKNIFAKN